MLINNFPRDRAEMSEDCVVISRISQRHDNLFDSVALG
jgi:hypothetical protein